MARKHIAKFPASALLIVAAISASASEFWVAKDWHQWSKEECSRILVESPWAHVKKIPNSDQASNSRPPAQRGNSNPPPLANSQSQAAPPAPVPASASEDSYAVQIRSALPIRQAIVRQLEIAQQYYQKTGEQRKAFDDAAGKILTASYDKAILVRLYFAKDAPGLRPDQIKNLQAMLVTEDGQQIVPTQVDADPMTPYVVDLYFPRLVNGAPAINSAQKQFSFQFQTPQYLDTKGVNVMPKRVRINFDLTKMLVDGKLNY
jgi:hypothetical protein